MARILINYHEVGKTIRFDNGLKVRITECKKEDLCVNCAFAKNEFVRSFSGQMHNVGVICSLTNGITNCTPHTREDGKYIAYVKIK